MRRLRIALALLVSLYACTLLAQKPAPADQVFENAKAQAAHQQELIFLVFGASWCPPCHELDSFMAARQTRPVLEKYFVLAKLNVEEEVGHHPERNSPGGEELMAKLGGADTKGKSVGVPFLVFLDATGAAIVNSNRPVKGRTVGENIGFPSEPEEIDWFMAMLKKATPSMTADELHTIEKWLRNQSAIDHSNLH
jgi:thioredoxin-related protein